MSPSADVHDTQDKYKLENVSYGWGYTTKLAYRTEIEFASNRLTTATRIDERNLKYSLYLNLYHASITELNTSHLSALLVLNLDWCKIKILDTSNLVNIVYLQIQKTPIKNLNTHPLGRL